jgi:hypothetical protein
MHCAQYIEASQCQLRRESRYPASVDRFLSSLGIREWDVEQFVGHLERKSLEVQPYPHFMSWLASKPIGWHQEMYLLLFRQLATDAARKRLSLLKIVRLGDGSYSVGSKCYFPGDGIEDDKLFPRVEKLVYSSGKSQKDREEAVELLQAIGVRGVGELERVQAILKQRYTPPTFRPDLNDLTRFIALVSDDKGHAQLFREYCVIKNGNGMWRKPTQIYLDSPVFETGLTAFYEAPLNAEKRTPIASCYADLGLAPEIVRSFFEAIGAQTRLEVVMTTCPRNDEWLYLSSVRGDRLTSPIDRDFYIPTLDKLLLKPTIALSKLIWRTMSELPRQPSRLEARYQKNIASGYHDADSQLVQGLRKCAWVPQQSGKFVRPGEAERGLLPAGFPFDAGADWIKRMKFGGEIQQRSEQSKQSETEARKMGFSDLDSLERAKQFAAFPQSEQERILAEHQRNELSELPNHGPRNPVRRAEEVSRLAAAAPERVSEQRSRAVSLGRDEVRQEAEQYLRQQYTNADGQMCQICKGPLPFKLTDGRYYCEKVEFLAVLRRRHYQNYLSLCPNHGAMFQHANSSENSMKDLFAKMDGRELPVTLAQKRRTVFFTETHIADLKAVIKVDKEGMDDGDA